ncbi:hypothetical protein TSUD_282100 [Trifolium subterraneum]|uniref:Reverse transcriptase domain-containing protein n=1 Tax=Trifolium subterraneum TaxID=3900 RepID=A0A2Z6LZ25_TRISU|nr:hypothetical protein TSUD_282100 [Trifolium subterraneum]
MQVNPFYHINRVEIKYSHVLVRVALQDIPLFHVNFWVQIHDVPIGMMLETVGKGLANYIGEFVEYDKNNNTSFWRKYMRVNVRVDVRSPLKIEKKIKLNENKCEVKYAMERDDGRRSWSNEIKAEVRRPGGRVGSRWLHEEGRNMADVDAKNKCEVKYAMERDDGRRSWSNEIKAEVRRPGGRVGSRWLHEEGRNMADVDASNTSGERGSQQTGPAQTNVASPRESRGPENGGIVSTVRGHIPPLRPAAVRQSSSIQGSFTEASVVSLISNRPILAITNDNTTTTQLTTTPALNEGNQLDPDDMDKESRTWWLRVGGRENLEVVDRVTRCANKLQRWGKKKRIRFKEEIDECVRQMNELRGNQDEDGNIQYQELSERHATLLIQEEGNWKQRAKMHWLQEGDMNTRFFHMSATVRSKKKKVTKLIVDNGTEAHTQEELCEVAKSYFDTLFKPRDGDHDPVLNLIQPRVTDDDNFVLTAPITKVEIQQVLFQMHPDKSPGPDGFNPAFYQRFWEQCSDDIFSAASTWLERGYFPTSLNETNICLIPKCDNPTSMKDLRPISLCNVLYKMISKVLANRLKCCLDKCVSQEQSAFVEGRLILDNALIATEVIHALKRKTKGRRCELALKIDISKAYDKVDWGFLRGVMTKMGFADVWIRWVMICVSSVNDSVLMNSDRVGPISPECLTALIHQDVGRDGLHGVRICRGAPEVSHLLFADDCFLLCRANVAEVNELMRILHTYETASGQEVNLLKSEVFISRNMSQAAKEDISRILGVKLVLGTSIYLGLPSMVGRSKKAIFSYSKDRVWKRINSWRGRALSKAGKEIMIKSVLQVGVFAFRGNRTTYPGVQIRVQSIPTTNCSTSSIGSGNGLNMYLNPRVHGSIPTEGKISTSEGVEKVVRGGRTNNNNTKGIHWLAWERLACPKAHGGLGFRNFEAFNKAMVAKQVWNIVQNPNSLVAKLIKARYFPHSSLFEAPLGYNPSFAWRSMWQPRKILSLGCVYQLSVRDLLHENYKAWNIVKVRNLFSKDVAEKILETPLVSSVREDKVVWEEERNGCYSVKSGYKLAMRYIIGCLPTRSRLLERRVECTLNCPVCDEEIEDELHIFFRCAVARDSWSAAGLSSVLHNATYQHTNAMDRIFVVCSNESSDTVGRVAMLLWCIWHNRNDKHWNDNVQMSRQIGRHVFDAWNDWYSVHKLQSNNVSGTTEADLVRWEKPALDWVKCNIDVAFVSGSGRTSMGLCFRDNSGHFMAGMTQWQQTVISSVEGETWALLLAMEEARHR